MEGPARRAEMLLLRESRAEIKWGRGSDQPTSTQCSTPSPEEHLLNPAVTTRYFQGRNDHLVFCCRSYSPAQHCST